MFTPKSLLELFDREKVLRSGYSISPENQRLAELVTWVNAYRNSILNIKTTFVPDHQRQSRFVDALDTLRSLTPELIALYDDRIKDFESGELANLVPNAVIERYKQDRLTLHCLTDIMQEVRLCRFLEESNGGVATEPEWTLYARALIDKFHRFLHDQSTEAGYRFVRAVLPHVTGHEKSLEAVKTHIKRKRPVKRGKRT